MSYTAAEAITLLNNPEFQGQDGLINLIRQVSVATPADRPGVVTYTFAYSGSSGPNNTGPRMGDIAKFISENSVLSQNIRVIDSSAVAEFLQTPEFLEAGLRAFSGDDVLFENWLYEAKTGPWAVASEGFITATNGPIQPFSTFADAMRTLALVEVPTALNTQSVSYIDEIPNSAWDGFRAGFVDSGMTNDAATDAVRQMISFKSSLEIQNTVIGVELVPSENGVMQQRITWMDTAKWAVGVEVPEFPQGAIRMTLGELAGPPSAEYVATLSNFVAQLKQTANIDKYWTNVEKYGKVLGTAGGILAVMDLVKTAFQANEAWQSGHQDQALQMVRDWSLGTSGAFLAGGVAFQGLAFLLEPLALLGPLGIAAGVVTVLGVSIYAAWWGHGVGMHMGQEISDLFTSATVATAPVRRDPLTFDLDNDGLETTGIDTANPIYFDHNADGVKTATGWVSADDAFLVMDKNANGSIDNGRELFGDAFIKSDGQLAADGFDALRDLDSNGDGVVDASDAQFANLRLWRDLNQDGVNQANELFTLGSQNISAINTGSTAHSQILANGNQLADLGSFVKTDGSSGTLGEVSGNLGDINLVQDTFHSQFADTLDTTGFETLPDMQGAGQVRSLREAATLSPVLAQLLTDFAAADRTGQLALLDAILKAWSDTSPMAATFTGAYDGHSLTVNMQNLAAGGDAYTALADKLTILEHFNGRTFNAVPDGTAAATVNLWTTSQDLLQRSYDSLKESVYQSLAIQTRLKPLLDLVGLSVAAEGIQLHFTELNQELDARIAADEINGFADLVELAAATNATLIANGWQGWWKVFSHLDTHSMTTEMRNVLDMAGLSLNGTTQSDAIVANSTNDTISAGDSNDWVYGAGGDDRIDGGAGDDVILGGNGNDYLWGSNGADILDGGAGNDLMDGGTGNDLFIVRKGSNADRLYDHDTTVGNVDRLQFVDVRSDEVTSIQRSLDDLLVYYNPGDYLRITNYFTSADYRIEQFEFVDGVTWGDAAIKARVITYGDASANTITGYNDGTNRIYGLDGNDYLYGGARANLLDGGNGDDRITGGANDDVILGGNGNDYLWGSNGADILDGGAGNDLMDGGTGNDLFIVRKGSNADRLYDHDTTAGNVDRLQFVDVRSDEVTSVQRSLDDLLVYYNPGDYLRITNYFTSADYRIEQFEFVDGVTWGDAAIKARVITYGDASANTITGYNDGTNRIYGLGGNDYLYGSSGNDTLDGGTGNDYLSGGTGNDRYLFSRDGGQDTVSDYDITAGNADTLSFNEGISSDQLWFRHVGSNLELSIIGTDDRLIVRDWYSGSAYHVEQFKTTDGLTLLDSQVDNLVNAMAAFAPPAAGQTSLPPDYQTALAPVLAANWR